MLYSLAKIKSLCMLSVLHKQLFSLSFTKFQKTERERERERERTGWGYNSKTYIPPQDKKAYLSPGKQS